MLNKHKIFIYILYDTYIRNNVCSFIAFQIKENLSVTFSEKIYLTKHKVIHTGYRPIRLQKNIHEFL